MFLTYWLNWQSPPSKYQAISALKKNESPQSTKTGYGSVVLSGIFRHTFKFSASNLALRKWPRLLMWKICLLTGSSSCWLQLTRSRYHRLSVKPCRFWATWKQSMFGPAETMRPPWSKYHWSVHALLFTSVPASMYRQVSDSSLRKGDAVPSEATKHPELKYP